MSQPLEPGAAHSPAPAPSPTPRRWPLIAVALAALAGIPLAVILTARHAGPDDVSPPPAALPVDPRLTYAGPYQNVHPSVKYVGTQECARCHQEIARSYSQHPMGRSLEPIAVVAPTQRYDEAVRNPFEAMGSTFRVKRQRDSVWHLESRRAAGGTLLYEHELPVHYALGHGTHGLSYLTERDGYLFQTPISWFAQKEFWGLSPGFGPPLFGGRPVPGDCLFCHTSRVEPDDNYTNYFKPPLFRDQTAIGCERCHGPGQIHAEGQGGRKDRATGINPTIVNPRHLAVSLRAAVCEQCHLEGLARVERRGRTWFDYRPGLPLHDFLAILVQDSAHGDEDRAVNHVEQMYQSACFRGSPDSHKLGCTSCHDPHRPVASEQRVAHYRGRCLQCHEKHRCSLPLPQRLAADKDDSCIACHMKRYENADIVHTASTNHRIPRRPEKQSPARPGQAIAPERLTHFYRDRLDPHNREGARDLGLGLALLAGQTPPLRKPLALRALDLLEGPLRAFPDDLPAWEAQGQAQAFLDDPGSALHAFEKVLARAPGRELSLAGAAYAAEQLHSPDRARDYWQRAVKANPWSPSYRRGLTSVLLAAQQWDEALAQARAWLGILPGDADARMVTVVCLWQKGQREAARAEFTRLEALRPPNLEQWRAGFKKLQRSGKQ